MYMGSKDKNKDQGDSATEGASVDNITSPRDVHHTNRDLSQEREAQDTALAKKVVEAVARKMAKAHAYYQALLNERITAVIPTSFKVTSRALGFKVMDPFDYTKDKYIYQRWQLWSEKDGHALVQWKVIQKRLKFHISTNGLLEKGWAKLNPGKTKISSSATQNMTDWRKKASTLQKR